LVRGPRESYLASDTRSLLAGQVRVLRRERMVWTGCDGREFRGRDRGVRVRGAGYGGLPCSPRAPGGVPGQRRGEARRAEGGRLPIYEPGVQEWFLDWGASPATAALLERSFGGLERSGGALHSRRKRSRRRMGRALDELTAKDARGFLSHCGYCSMDQLP
jgi:hypothetical protein